MRITPKLLSAEEVWSYAARTLTQAKFPFWSAIITQNAGSVSVPAYATVYVDIQPPTGEVWLLHVSASEYTANSSYEKGVGYGDFDGTTLRLHERHYSVSTTGVRLGGLKILSNSLYARLSFYSYYAAGTGYYGYSGFKLSQPIWTPKRVGEFTLDPKPWKKPTTLSLPDPIKPLQKYAFEMLELDPSKPDEYVLGVVLEEDTVLAVDPDTGFPVERLTAVVKADDLVNIISGIKAGTLNPVATGYKKHLEKWAREGIKL
jgi:hypothetical protein